MPNSKDKGKRFELMIAQILRNYGYETRRSAQYCGNTGDAADVVGLNGIHIECKAQERMNLYEWMAQAIRDSENTNELPAVFHKQNRKDILVTMRLSDWITLYKASVLDKR